MTLQQDQQGETSSPSPEAPTPAQQSQADFKDRVSASLERALNAKQSAEDEGDVVEEADAPPPKAKPAKAKSTEVETGKADSEKSGSGKTTDTSSTESDTSDAGERPQPRYDSRSFSKWVTNNPEKAAELAAKVFKVQLGDTADGWKKHFISAENKRRRNDEASEKERAAFEAEKAEVNKTVNETLAAVQPILDVVEAESKNDFPAIDLFIETTFGMSFNDYCAKRLRGSSKESTAERAAKLKAEKLEKELAELKSGKAKESEKTAEEKPAVSAKWVEKEVPADHDVRDLADWSKKVQEAYADSFDEETEEYGLSVEEAADRVLKSWLKKHKAEPEATKPKPKVKPKARLKPRDEDDDDEERTPARDLEQAPTDMQERVRWALERAATRR